MNSHRFWHLNTYPYILTSHSLSLSAFKLNHAFECGCASVCASASAGSGKRKGAVANSRPSEVLASDYVGWFLGRISRIFVLYPLYGRNVTR